MNFKQRIAELNLPENGFVVVGSGILNALGIRESGDIDLVVTDKVYREIGELGWERELWGNNVVFKNDVFDVSNVWYSKSAKDLLKHVEIIDGVPYLSLDDVYEWKKQRGQEKDIRDLKLIDEYRQAN